MDISWREVRARLVRGGNDNKLSRDGSAVNQRIELTGEVNSVIVGCDTRAGKPVMDKGRRQRGPRPRGEFKDKHRTLTTRITEVTRQKLDAACTASGRSLSQEIESRLDRTFERESLMFEALDLWCGPKLAGFLLLLGHTIGPLRIAAAASTGQDLIKFPSVDWSADPFVYEQAVRAANRILERYRPAGDPSPLTADPVLREARSKIGVAIVDQVLEKIAEGGRANPIEGEIRDRLGAPRPSPGRGEP